MNPNGRPRVPALVRLMEKVRIDPSGCWLWTGHIGKFGYGSFRDDPKRNTRQAHIASYELHVGPVPDGLELDHLCRVRSCVNPYHLEPVTHLENVRRGDLGRITHCPQGHLYDKKNTYLNAGKRHCRECGRRSALVYYHKRKQDSYGYCGIGKKRK